MLIKDFYTVVSCEKAQNSIVCRVKLNADHEVYKGHFPQRPITPGVCNIQIIKEIAQMLTGNKYSFKKIDKCRLPAMVTPDGTPDLDVKVDFIDPENPLKISASIFFDQTIFMALSGELEIIQ